MPDHAAETRDPTRSSGGLAAVRNGDLPARRPKSHILAVPNGAGRAPFAAPPTGARAPALPKGRGSAIGPAGRNFHFAQPPADRRHGIAHGRMAAVIAAGEGEARGVKVGRLPGV